MSPGPLDLYELCAGADTDQEPKSQNHPPEPRVLVPDQLGGPLHDEGPLGEGEAEAGEGAVPGGDGVAEAHQQQEADPVEEEGGEECGEECEVRAEQRDILVTLLPLPASVT